MRKYVEHIKKLSMRSTFYQLALFVADISLMIYPNCGFGNLIIGVRGFGASLIVLLSGV